MPFRHEKVEIKLPKFFAGHGSHMIKLLLTVQISYIEYSKNRTVVNATSVVALVDKRMRLKNPIRCGCADRDIQDSKKL